MSRSAANTASLVLEYLAGCAEPQTQRQIRGTAMLTSNQVQCALTRLMESGHVMKVPRAGRHSVYLLSPKPPGDNAEVLRSTPASAFAQAPIWPAPSAPAIPFGRPLLGATHAMEALLC